MEKSLKQSPEGSFHKWCKYLTKELSTNLKKINVIGIYILNALEILEDFFRIFENFMEWFLRKILGKS